MCPLHTGSFYLKYGKKRLKHTELFVCLIKGPRLIWGLLNTSLIVYGYPKLYGQVAPKSFNPGFFAPCLTNWNVTFEARFFGLLFIERGILHLERAKWLEKGGEETGAKWPVTLSNQPLALSSWLYCNFLFCSIDLFLLVFCSFVTLFLINSFSSSQLNNIFGKVVYKMNCLVLNKGINTLGPKSDQHQFSPNNISRSLRVKVMRFTQLITKGRILWS